MATALLDQSLCPRSKKFIVPCKLDLKAILSTSLCPLSHCTPSYSNKYCLISTPIIRKQEGVNTRITPAFNTTVYNTFQNNTCPLDSLQNQLIAIVSRFNNMKAETLSIFIEANRFPPAISPRRYSIIRAEAEAVAKQNSDTVKDNTLSRKSCAKPDMTTLPAHEIYELEADEIHDCSLLTLPEIESTPFNPFDEPLPSPVSPVEPVDSSMSTPLPSPEPPTNFLNCFIPKYPPFDPYEEKYVAHPAGEYIAYKYKDKRRVTIAAPSGLPMPVTPAFFDENRSLSTASSPVIPSFTAMRPADRVVATRTHDSKPISYTPPGSPLEPFKIARKPLPPGVRPFTPSQYPPPGSSEMDIPRTSARSNTDARIISPIPRRSARPGTTDFTSASNLDRTLPVKSTGISRAHTSRPKTNKPLPPLPSSSRKTRPSSSVPHHHNRTSQKAQHTSRSTDRTLRAIIPLNHRDNWEQEESSRHRTIRRSSSGEL